MDTDGVFEIILRFLDGEELRGLVDRTTIARDVMEFVVAHRQLVGIDLMRVRILYNGVHLHCVYNLSRFGVRPGSILEVVIAS